MGRQGKLSTTQRRILNQGIRKVMVDAVSATYDEEGTDLEAIEGLYYVIDLIDTVIDDCSQ